MSVYDVLAQAIEERRVVTFTYDGFLREVEPFLLDKIVGLTTCQKQFSGERPLYNPADEGMQSIGVHI